MAPSFLDVSLVASPARCDTRRGGGCLSAGVGDLKEGNKYPIVVN
jgi:hypothetical protein